MNTMDETKRVWKVFESLYDEGHVRKLGLRNIYDINQLKEIYDWSRIKPSIIQNRFYAKSNFDTDIRNFIKDHTTMTYQSFWTLSANRKALNSKKIKMLAKEKNLTPQTLMYAFMTALGYATPLDGTTNINHMIEDMDVMDRIQSGEIILNDDEIIYYEEYT